MRDLVFRVVLGFGVFASAVASHAQWDAAALVRRPAQIHGVLDGSLRQIAAEDFVLSGNGMITRDLLVVHRPPVQLRGRPDYEGTIDFGRGLMTHGFSVTLVGKASLRHVVRGCEPLEIPADIFARPESVSGAIRKTIRVADHKRLELPPGDYGRCDVSGRGRLILGSPDTVGACEYEFRSLTIAANARVEIVGPVLIRIREGLLCGGVVGSAKRRRETEIRLGGDVTLSGSARLFGYVISPSGKIAVTANAELIGGLMSDELEIGGHATVHIRSRDDSNEPPIVEILEPSDGAEFSAGESFGWSSAAADLDGEVRRVQLFIDGCAVDEKDAQPFSGRVSIATRGDHRLRVRAFDDDGAFSDSPEVAVTILGANLPPRIDLVQPKEGLIFAAPARIVATTEATDPDGMIARVEFLLDGAIVDATTSPPFAGEFTVQGEGSYQLWARAFDNFGDSTDSDPVAVTVVLPNDPPSVRILEPEDGDVFAEPQTIQLRVEATDPDGTVETVEFFEDITSLGVDATPPFVWSVQLTEQRDYRFLARATDNRGAATDSAPVTLTVERPNLRPSVALLQPNDGAILALGTSILLSAFAHDPDGKIQRVEFRVNGSCIGESVVFPFELHWNPSTSADWSVSVVAFDDRGGSMESAPVRVSTREPRSTLPMQSGFESGEGGRVGSFEAKGWFANGEVDIARFSEDAQCAVLMGGASPSSIQCALTGTADETVFVDFLVKLIASDSPEEASQIRTTMAGIALLDEDGAVTVAVYQDDRWESTGVEIEIDDEARSVGWLRFTTRENYSEGCWDIYLNGRMIAAALSPEHASDRIDGIECSGALAGETLVDRVTAAVENPLGEDADRDGMLDDWEQLHGLHPGLDDRYADADADGLRNVFELVYGTDPGDPDSDGDGMDDGWETSHGTNALENDAEWDEDQDGLSTLEEFSSRTDPQHRDSDRDGLPDGWESVHGLDQTASDATGDLDGDGVSNLDEFISGSDPNDYYNGIPPVVISLVGANGELSEEGALEVLLTDADGEPLVDAPFAFRAVAGGHRLAATPTGPAEEGVTVRTDLNGIARAWVRGGAP